jgi:hypothetical protein
MNDIEKRNCIDLQMNEREARDQKIIEYGHFSLSLSPSLSLSLSFSALFSSLLLCSYF